VFPLAVSERCEPSFLQLVGQGAKLDTEVLHKVRQH
jgi:hypothetical protein